MCLKNRQIEDSKNGGMERRKARIFSLQNQNLGFMVNLWSFGQFLVRIF